MGKCARCGGVAVMYCKGVKTCVDCYRAQYAEAPDPVNPAPTEPSKPLKN